ncbi:MAG: 2Fe-2S iron-sulfur cluster-binding protein [bacterium]|nr:2Fe-2S iron-sulfur cluster binding domain-containing protein [Gammaproteobacteria bacterium]HIL98069.1 2Fe-2S iron-sulfur cluster binding domain-containing protein [Pseudomonadales bacterium]
MPKITFVESNGTQHTIEIPNGNSLMQGAIDNVVPGIEGDCGGLCACATCHVYITADWQQHCQEAEELETYILDFAFEVNEKSRLACQIEVSNALDGMQVHLPKRQY